MGWWLLLCLAAARPTDGALRKAFERNRHAVVEVVGPKKTGAGVMASADGHVVTAVDFVGLDATRVRIGGELVDAQVVTADAVSRVAVVKLLRTDDYRASPVRVFGGTEKGAWLVGVRRGKGGKLEPALARVIKAGDPFVVLDLPLPPGSPLFDESGKLVAIVVKQGTALPFSVVKAKIAADEKLAGGAK